MNLIPTEKLKIADLPRKRPRWDRITEFASTFDLKKEYPKGIIINSLFDVSEDSSILELRLALYIEWRRYNHFSSDPESDVLKRAWDILEWIHNKL